MAAHSLNEQEAAGAASGDGTSAPASPVGASIWSAAGSILQMQHQMPPIVAVPRTELMAVSPAQERLWLLEQSEPGTPYYNVTVSWTIHGALQEAALEQALAAIVQRHEALRTTFPEVEGRPVLRIHDRMECRLQRFEIAAPSDLVAESELTRQTREFIRAPFDFAAGPLFRFGLFRLAADEQVLVFVVHQMVFDGWSIRVLCRELGECYRAQVKGTGPALPALPIQYADFAVWQRRWLHGEVLEGQITFWRQQLQRSYEPLRLPTDHPPGAGAFTPCGKLSFVVPKPLMDALKQLSHQTGVTHFAALLATFNAMLGRCTGQEDVLLLVSMAGRTQPELRNLVGLVANILPVRSSLAGNPSFRELLKRAAEVSASAMANQALPLARIMELVPGAHTRAGGPPTQVMLVYNNVPMPSPGVDGTRFTPSLAIESGTTRYDWWFDLADSPQGLQGFLKFRSDLYEPSTMQRWVDQWQCLIGEAVAHPDEPFTTLRLEPVAPGAARVEPVRAAAPPAERAMIEVFREQAARTPRAVACECGAQTLTYAEVNAQSTRLAAYLRSLGVQAGRRVLLAINPSLESVLAVLAGHKLGAILVPLDPEADFAQRAAIARQAEATVLLATASVDVSGLPRSTRRIDLDAAEAWRSGLGSISAAGPAGTEPLAWLWPVFEANQPVKFLPVSHTALAAEVRALRNRYGVLAEDGIETRGFRAFTRTFYLPLVCGARLVITAESGVQSGAESALARRATILQLGQAALEEIWDGKAVLLERGIRHIGCFLRDVVPLESRLWAGEHQSAEVHLFYGAAEAGGVFLAGPYPREAVESAIPVGLPLPSHRVEICDAASRPVPPGVVGQLQVSHVAGAAGGEPLIRTAWLARRRGDDTVELMVAPVPRRSDAAGREIGEPLDHTPPASELEAQLKRAWETVFGVPELGVRQNFFALGGHSLLAARLVTEIEKATGRRLRLSTIFQFPTIAGLAAALSGQVSAQASSIVALQPEGALPPLYLVHGVGGGMFWGYNNLARHLGSEQPILAFKSRGLDGLEEFSTIEEMAAHYVADLRRRQPLGPYYLGGYCFGGNVAYEMARQLAAEKQTIAILILINCWPSNSAYSRVGWTPLYWARFLWNVLYRVGYRLRHGSTQRHDFFRWRTTWFTKRFRKLFRRRTTPSEPVGVQDFVDLSHQPADRQRLWSTHVKAWLNYQPKPYAGPVNVFRTRGHPLVCSFDYKLGWEEFAKGGVRVTLCPGDHESVLEEVSAAVVARELQARLASARAAQAGSSPC